MIKQEIKEDNSTDINEHNITERSEERRVGKEC